jgi:hypothetical protein
MLSNKAMLVNLRISQWVGRKLDRKATDTVETTHSTESRVGNYTKKLLPGAKELENINRHAGAIRTFFYEQTLPWCADGSRIIKSTNYMEFTAKFRAMKSEFDTAVAEFLTAYPTLKEQAKAKLGDLYREMEYPTTTHLTHAFECGVTFMPLPDVSDFRVDLSESEKAEFVASMQCVEQDAIKECWHRMHDVVAKAAAKLSDPKAIFRDSLIENIQEMCQLMPKLNVTDDTELDSMRRSVEDIVKGISVNVCREVDSERERAARALAEVTNKMAGFMS